MLSDKLVCPKCRGNFSCSSCGKICLWDREKKNYEMVAISQSTTKATRDLPVTFNAHTSLCLLHKKGNVRVECACDGSDVACLCAKTGNWQDFVWQWDYENPYKYADPVGICFDPICGTLGRVYEFRQVPTACAIATACLGTSTYSELDTLRTFRRSLESCAIGQWMSRHYDRVKEPVATLVARNDYLRGSMLYLFVRPGLFFAKRRDKMSRMGALTCYLLVLMFASVLYLPAQLHKK